jgi:hypothetical protein
MFASEITIWRCRTVASLNSPILVAFVTITVIVRIITSIPITWDLLWLIVCVPTIARIHLPANVVPQLKDVSIDDKHQQAI